MCCKVTLFREVSIFAVFMVFLETRIQKIRKDYLLYTNITSVGLFVCLFAGV